MTPAVVVGGNTMALGVVRRLGARGVPVVSVNYDAYRVAQRSRYASIRIRLAHPDDAPEAFIDGLVDIGRRHRSAALIPASDASLAAVARAHDQLADHFAVGCSDWPSTEQFLDKSKTYALAHDAGLAVPMTITPTTEEDVAAYAETARFPLLVKPSHSHLYVRRFGVKMEAVETPDELWGAWRRATEHDLTVMLQELIPGPDRYCVNYNVLAANGTPLVEFTAQQLRSAPPFYGSPRVAVSRAIPQAIEPGRRLIEALKYDGFACVEFKYDRRDGRLKLMELNGRHNLSSLLAPACGIDFPWLHYRYLTEGHVPRREGGFREGVYWIDSARDIATTLRSHASEHIRLSQYVAPYLGPNVYAVASLTDPAPFALRTVDALQRLSGPRRDVRRRHD